MPLYKWKVTWNYAYSPFNNVHKNSKRKEKQLSPDQIIIFCKQENNSPLRLSLLFLFQFQPGKVIKK